MVSILALGPGCPGLISSVPKKLSEGKNFIFAEDSKQCCFEESEQWLENVDPTHPVLASAEQELEKKFLDVPRNLIE